MNKLQALYDSEINASLSWFWDEGFDWDLGDPQNGWKDAGCERTLTEAIDALWEAAKRCYPDATCFKGEKSEKPDYFRDR